MTGTHRATALATVEESTPAVSSNETWYVATAAGVRVLNLDELDRALCSGELDVTTPVWIPGMAEWETLGSVANLEDGPPLDQGPGVPPYHGSAPMPGLFAVPAPEPSTSVDGPLSEALPDSDPSDPNHALWVSIAPRPSRPVQSGIWRRVEPAPGARQRHPWRPRARRAAVLAGVVLMLLGAWRWLARGLDRSESRGQPFAMVTPS